MNYTRLKQHIKGKIIDELADGKSVSEVSRIFKVTRQTVRNVRDGLYYDRQINSKYDEFINYIENNLDSKTNGVEVCIHKFKMKYPQFNVPSSKTVYN